MNRLTLFIILIIITTSLSACASKESSKIEDNSITNESSMRKESNKTKERSSSMTMDDVLNTFRDNGITVELKDKPLYQMVGASDGVMFEIEGSVVKIYEFKSEEDYQEQKEKYDLIKDMPVKGRFVLDTNNSKAIEIFNKIEE